MRLGRWVTGCGCVAAVVAGFAAPAAATLTGIINVSGANSAEITSNPPDPVQPDPNDGKLLAWDEQQNVTLQNDLRVDRVFDPNASFVTADGDDFLIEAGTEVSSHYVQWDPGNGSSSSVQATMQADSQIFAFMTEDQHLFDSDDPLGLNIDYNDFNNRGLESGDTTDFNGQDVDIDWSASSPGDWTRLITAFSPSAAPELTSNNDPENAATVAFGNVRVGTSAGEDLTLTNDGGDDPAGLDGTVPGAGGEFALEESASFGPLAPNTSASRRYSFSPGDRGAETLNAGDIDTNDPDGTGDADTPLTLTGAGVGPVADFPFTSPGGTIDFGEILAGDMVTTSLTVENVTADPDGALSDLTLNDAAIAGLDAGKFDLVGFTPGEVIGKGGGFDLQIKFNPAGTVGTFADATLTLLTDQGTALGGDGDDFTFGLEGTAIPEPASLALLAPAGLLLLRRRAA